MQITARDIKEMEFSKKNFKGYDVEEVKNFLEMVASEYEKLILENNKLKNKVKNLEDELENYRNKNEKLDKILLTAQNFAENEQERVEKEIKLKYKEAEINIEKMMNEAAKEKAQLESEVQKIKHKKNRLIEDFERNLDKQKSFLKELKSWQEKTKEKQ